jgi:hypothetical protein
MTWWQVSLLVLVGIALAACWYKYSMAVGPLRRAGELYLWLVLPMAGLLKLIHDGLGLSVMAGVGALHLIITAAALWGLSTTGDSRTESSPIRLTSALFIVGSIILWLGAATWPGPTLRGIAAHRADHLFTSGTFLLGTLLTLAGLTILRSVLRVGGDQVLSQLGLISFLFGAICWSIHLAFRVTVTLPVAQEAASSGVPAWFGPLLSWSGAMYAIYMVLAYLAMAAYGAAMQKTGWVGKGWGRTLTVLGLVAAAGFLGRLVIFDPPAALQIMPYAIGMLLLRKVAGEKPTARAV